jgi:peptidoglycan/xylan/chitin deacetylase (PgdA/CDA1 family)
MKRMLVAKKGMRRLRSVALASVLAFAAGFAGPQQASAYFQEKSVVYSGLQGTKTLALTFDDGPTNQTDEVLDALKENGVKATFFVLGRNIDNHPAMLDRMRNEGHLIANHTTTHPRLGQRFVRNQRMLIREIGGAHDEIAPFLRVGQELYFRAPYGFWKKEHAEALNADPILKHYVGPIYWDVGGYTAIDDSGNASASADWDCWRREWTADECAMGYMREIRRKKGGVVLFHDVRMRTATMVKQILPALVRDGYSFITLDKIPAYDKLKTPPDQPVGKPVSSLDTIKMQLAAISVR